MYVDKGFSKYGSTMCEVSFTIFPPEVNIFMPLIIHVLLKKCATKVYKVIQNGKRIKSLTYGKHVDFTYIHCVDVCLLGNLGLLFSNHIVWMFVYWEMLVYYFLITVHLYAF